MQNNITEYSGSTSPALIEINGGYFERYISYLDATQKTAETYTRALKQLLKYLTINGITQPTRADIIAYKDDLRASGHKPTTIQNYITAAKLFFQWTAQENLYPNITEHLKGVKLNREHKKDYLTSSQVKDILNSIERDTVRGLRDYAMLSLMVTAGLRTIEVSRANVEDLRTVADFTALYVQGKGREEKTEYIKISAPIEKAIRAYLKERGTVAPSDPLFTSLSNNNKGARLTTRSISGTVKQRLKSAGYDSERLTAHSLRHTAVTLALLAGNEITEVQQFARHKSIDTTMIYNHALDAAKNTCSDAITAAIM